LKRTISILSFLVVFLPVFGQQPNLYFKKINNSNGLSNNKVSCILQDKRGFTWIGTDDGLNRYDGNNFLIFRNKPGSPIGISGNIITGLFEDENEIIWVVTSDGGLSKYDYRLTGEKQFKQFKNIPGNPSSIPVNIINAIVQDDNNFLWLATSGKRVIRFNKKTEKFDEPINKGTATAIALCIDNKKNLWAGRQGGGLLKINTQSLKYEVDERYSNLYAKLPHAVVTSLFMDSEKNMWYGSWDKMLYKFNTNLQKEEAFQQSPSPFSFTNDEVYDFAEDSDGRIWMAGRYGGLHLLDKKTKRFYNYRFNPSLDGTIADNTVNCLFIDKKNNLWVGTNKGISVSSLHQQFVQQFLPGTPGNGVDITIYDFFRDKNKTLWIGTSNGIYSKKSNSPIIEHMPVTYAGEKLAVTKFYKDEDGAMYFGTNYSLFRYNPAKRSIEPLPDAQQDKVMTRIISSRVVSVIRDTINNNPVLLTSPYGHFLTYYDLKEKKWISRLDSSMNIVSLFGLTDNLIRKIYRSPDGRIWLSNAKDGLGLWEKNPQPRVKYFKNNPADAASITNNNVFDVTGDATGNLWITTNGGGLSYFNKTTNKFKHITASANLLEGVQMDADGNVWMVGSGNLHRYTPATDSYSSFELPDIEKSGGIKGYMYKNDEGLMYAAGTNYFITFKGGDITENIQSPQVLFTGFKIFDNSFSHLLFQKKIKLKYNQNFFTIEFASPHYSGNEKIHYSYMLEGVDKDWVDAGSGNFASYPNTGSGSFSFKVRASVGNGKWGEAISALQIEVVPPFWKRWWFYLLCALFIAGVLYTIYRYRVNELMKRQAIRNKIAQDLHDNIGSTLSSISVYSEVAKIHGGKNEMQGLNDVLEKISGTSNEMVAEMNDIVWAINPRNDSMEKIVQRMESFAKPLAAARKILFDFQYNESVLSLQLDMDKRKNFYLVFKEAVNNAIKYSGASELAVSVSSNNHQLKLTVKDNGVGFNPEKEMSGLPASLSGNGLKNMHARTSELKGTILIDSQPGKGTSIKLIFPLS
jgi:ligand-binding sensor domain-containing protein/anti-sigma regulatory factor (Ser/Thr protein kinase)